MICHSLGQYPENSPRSSKCSCLTWSSPSNQTRRYLFRQQSENQTTEQFQCDFCKFSLQHSLWSQVALRATSGASCSKPYIPQPRPACRGFPSLVTTTSPRLLVCVQTGMVTERSQPRAQGWGRLREGICRAPKSRTDRLQAALASPQMLARLCSTRQEDPEVIPALEHGQK